MPLIFTVDGRPTYIPPQYSTRQLQAPSAVRRAGKVVKTFNGYGWKNPDGTVTKLTQQRAKEKGVKAFLWPGTQEVLHVSRPSRRRKRFRKFLRKYALNPYILGGLTGFALPKILSASHTVLAGTGIAVAGYFSPQGSYVRKFSIGAGLGAGLQAGLEHKATLKAAAKLVAEAASIFSPTGAALGASFAAGLLGISTLPLVGGALVGGVAVPYGYIHGRSFVGRTQQTIDFYGRKARRAAYHFRERVRAAMGW